MYVAQIKTGQDHDLGFTIFNEGLCQHGYGHGYGQIKIRTGSNFMLKPYNWY